ncbi:hypothetical protein JTB14_033925 [Gonioctena quinquepunctata]|nr:hypothetical protein JTB14_033925 [Gonioctena quinquepunctata]
MEFTELFKIWHKINTSISGEDTETALENQDLTSSLDNEIFDDILNNLNCTHLKSPKLYSPKMSPTLYSPESNKAESPKKCDLDKSAPINLKPNEPNIFSNIQPIVCPVSSENPTEISSELSVNSITIQHYEAATEQAPSNINQKDNLVDIDYWNR